MNTDNYNDMHVVPEHLSSVWLKRFFLCRLGLRVRVHTLAGKARWIDILIREPETGKFPEAFGNRCMRVAYAGSPQLCEQNWGGNISCRGVTLVNRQWREVLQQMIDNPIDVLVGSNPAGVIFNGE